MDHGFYMGQVLELASACLDRGEVPVGALLVRDGSVLATSGNTREESQSPLGHAEVGVIQKAAADLGSWRLNDATLYVSIEPCLLCTGVIYASRISRVVFGARNNKGGSLLYIENHRKELNLNHSVEIIQGILETEAANLLQSFFQSRRD